MSAASTTTPADVGLHLYCIAPAGRTPPPLTGVQDAPVAALPAAGLLVWCSEHDAVPEASVAALRAHHHVVAASCTMELTTVPARFGQWLPDSAALASRAAARAPDWRRDLDRVAGAAEYGLRVSAIAEADAARIVQARAAGSGRAYMEALARRSAGEASRERLRAAVAATIGEVVGGVVRATRVEPLAAPALASVAHLVSREAEADYVRRLEEVRRAFPELTILFTGPWPPYSFVA